jgi:hypothetical protein
MTRTSGSCQPHLRWRRDSCAAPAAWIDDYLGHALTNAGLAADMGDGGTTVRVSARTKRRPG